MSDEALLERLRIAAMLGDADALRRLADSSLSLRTIPASQWLDRLRFVPLDQLMRAAIHVVRSLLLPRWFERHPTDQRPLRAVEAAEVCLRRSGVNAARHALATAKACTTARSDSLGRAHRVAESARAVAWAATRPTEQARTTALAEALAKAEEELVFGEHVAGRDGNEASCRDRLLASMREILVPPLGASAAR